MNSLLPPSATPLERQTAHALGQLGDLDVPLRDLWNPDTCPARLLPWLAWSVAVDDWDQTWPESTKRAAIARQADLHRRRGTPWAVKRALASIGFDAVELIEHRAMHDAWLHAGGEILDGNNALDGASDLSIPPGGFRFITRHWAEFAVRWRIGDEPWNASRERAIHDMCRAYAPARSHLAAIILQSHHRFDASIQMAGFAARGRAVFDGCRRFYVPAFETIDGCDIIGGENIPDLLDGAGWLDGASTLRPYNPAGEPLDAGQLGLALRITTPLQLSAHGGTRQERPETLGDGMLLDGRHVISASLLDADEPLDGSGTLAYPSLAMPDEFLDGTSNLGEMPGPDTIWFSGTLRVQHGARIYQEPLQ